MSDFRVLVSIRTSPPFSFVSIVKIDVGTSGQVEGVDRRKVGLGAMEAHTLTWTRFHQGDPLLTRQLQRNADKSSIDQDFSLCICLFSLSGAGKLFSVRGQIVNLLGVVGYTISLTTTQFCHYVLRTVIFNA